MGARVEALRGLDEEQVGACLEALAPAAANEQAPAGALEAALILALAHPAAAEQHGVNVSIHGRRLAASLERAGEDERACELLRRVADALHGDLAVERALSSVMRRRGMIQDQVDRYFAHAQELVDQGLIDEAISWLREILQLDRSRKDVARMIRDLRYEQQAVARAGNRRVRMALGVLTLSLLFTLVALREVRVSRAFDTLPPAVEGDLTAAVARLDSLERFIDAHPVWHGSLGSLRERSLLRGEIERLGTQQTLARERETTMRRRMDALADSARARGRMAAESGDFESALADLHRALRLASQGWEHRARTRRDLRAIEVYIEQGAGS